MPNPDTIHIGSQTRTLRVNTEAMLFAQNLLPGNMSVRDALSRARDEGTIAVLAVAAFRTEDKNISLGRVCKWLDDEPNKSKELEAKVLDAYLAHYGHGGHVQADEKKDEARQSVPPPSPDAMAQTPSG